MSRVEPWTGVCAAIFHCPEADGMFMTTVADSF